MMNCADGIPPEEERMMKVLLVDVDSKIPNLALMKLSTFYKSKGWEVDFIKLGFNGYPGKRKIKVVYGYGYDKVHCSNIFTPNQGYFKVIQCDDVEIGGVGSINPMKKLPEDAERVEPDYSLYPENDTSYGFITRGCIRMCYFCFVPKTEGKLKYYMDPKDSIKHKKVSFMDNNFLAYKEHKEILKELRDLKVRCEFNQGLDIRLIDDENAKLLSELNYMGEYLFAFDDISYKPVIERQLEIVKRHIKKDWKIKFYVYVHPNMSIRDTIERVEWCRSNKVKPYIMRDKECWESENVKFYMSLASYCNQPGLFKNMSFETFLRKKLKDQERIEKEIRLYAG